MDKNGKFTLEDAGFNMGVNVKLTKRDKKTGRIIETREGHNTCLKMQLMGIVKWLNGDFNDTTQSYLYHYNWIPRYLGVGTNLANYETTEDVVSEVNINDTHLLSEISPRIKLPERNKIINRSSQRYIQLVISTYLPSEYYNGEVISEAGLFSGESGNNCLFRIVFDGITKTEDSIIEIDWTISVISVESTNQPYVESDKIDLLQKLEEILDVLRTTYDSSNTDLLDLINETKYTGIYDYGRNDIGQATIDADVALLDEKLEKFKEGFINNSGS